MFISVFIPTGNRASSLEIVLKSLTKQDYTNFEVIIVDYKSKDDTFKIIDKYIRKLKIKVIEQKTKGLVKAANIALRQAKGQIFVRTDDDVLVSRGWLKAISKTFSSNKNVGGVTGPTVIPINFRKNRDLFIFEQKLKEGNILWKIIGKLYFNYFMEGEPYRVSHWFDSGAFGLGSNFEAAEKEPLQEITNLEACNFSVRTLLLKRVGGFDTSYSGVGEYHEADAASKIKNLGYKLIFNPEVYLNHRPSQEGFFKERPASYSRMINFVIFYMRHIKPNTLRKLSRFALYLIFLDCYYFFMAVKTANIYQLGAIPGTLMGLIKYFEPKLKLW